MFPWVSEGQLSCAQQHAVETEAVEGSGHASGVAHRPSLSCSGPPALGSGLELRSASGHLLLVGVGDIRFEILGLRNCRKILCRTKSLLHGSETGQ